MSAIWLWASLGSAALGGVFGALHLSLHDLSKSTLLDLAERKGGKCLVRARKIVADLDGHAVAIALPRVAANLFALAAATVWVGALAEAPSITWSQRGLALALVVIVVWISGVLVPHAVAKHAGEVAVLGLSGMLRAWYLLVRPALVAWRFTSEVVRRLVGEAHQDASDALDSELMSVVEEGEREGQIDESEREMIEAIVELRTTTVEQVMTPRTEIKALEYTDDFESVRTFARASGHSRVPVYEENLDHIVGILYAKDLLRYLAGQHDRSGRAFHLKDILRPALFVPETKTVRDLLRDLIAEKVHIAMVADEYGGTSGLITVEDIVEEIVGEIRDEYELDGEPEPGIEVDEAARAATVDGRAYIGDVNDELDRFDVEIPEHEDYDTVAGYVVSKLGRIPEPGERFVDGPIAVQVLEAEPTRVTRVRIALSSQEAAGGPAGEGEGADRAAG